MDPQQKPLDGQPRKNQSDFLIHIAGGLSAICYIFTTINAQHHAALNFLTFIKVEIILILLWLGACSIYYRQPNSSLRLIILWGLLFRICGLFSFPILEDDIFRYLWDGYVTYEYGSPYAHAPAFYFSNAQTPENMVSILDMVSYPEIKTIYGPVAQYLFLLGYILAPADPWPLQLFATLADGLIVFLLVKHAQRQHLLLYLWCPLVIHCFSYNAHIDIIALAFLFLAIHLLVKGNKNWVAIIAATAIGVKIFACLFIPFLFGKKISLYLKTGIWLTIIYLPFIFASGSDLSNLIPVATQWQFNASIFSLLSNYLPFTTAFVCATTILFLTLFLHWIRTTYARKELTIKDFSQVGIFVYSVALLMSPVVNIWYLIWLLPFATITPKSYVWAATATFFVSYCSGINLNLNHMALYEIPPPLVILEYAIPFMVWLMPTGHFSGYFAGAYQSSKEHLVQLIKR